MLTFEKILAFRIAFSRDLSGICRTIFTLSLMLSTAQARAADGRKFADSIGPLLKERCVKCHGPAKAEGKLDLSTAAAVARGGENGPVVASHEPDESLIWERVAADEMPPKHPLQPEEKERIRQWILDGAPGLPNPSESGEAEHWAFRKLKRIDPPAVKNPQRVRNAIDRFVQADLEKHHLSTSIEASKERLIRRVSLVLTGLPPGSEELAAFVNDPGPDAYQKMVERYLASPRYGERWAKFWLDAAGYADSNGYFNADTDRPLAWRYRDYVIQAFDRDKPFDRFIMEQLAGDELPGFVPDQPVTPDEAERLIATHFLRNGQDGTGESDGNPDELRVDRYAALESCQQIVATSLLGLTMQCAKCHSHKFEPITQEDYYRFQAIFSPAYPAAAESLWVKPQARSVIAPTAEEKREWLRRIELAEARATSMQSRVADWLKTNRPRGEVLFRDDFDTDPRLSPRWSNVAPTDDQPGGNPPVRVDSGDRPGARIRDGRLEILAGVTLDSWLTTAASFDWTPNQTGEVIQVTFDLVDTRLSSDGKPAERVGFFLATHDFDDDGKVVGGNLLIDGHPSGPTAVFVDYPGKDAIPKGSIGKTGYVGGRNYGVRVTNAGDGKFQLEHVVDGFPDGGPLTLAAADLPDGGFGFEYHADRAFLVDHVVIERFDPKSTPSGERFARLNEEFRRLDDELQKAKKSLIDLKNDPPFEIAWTTDRSANPPDTHLLERGDYARPGPIMPPSPPSVFMKGQSKFELTEPESGRTTGRRLAFAKWLVDPDGPAAGLVARVQVNRIWQQHFGVGIVETPENLGLSGAPPSNPELLDWLAFEFVNSGWSVKHIQRLILMSATFRRSSDETIEGSPGGNRQASFPATRLDAESIRDAMLAVSGELDTSRGGPYVPIQVDGDGAVTIADSRPGACRRSIYLQQRRTQPVSMLQVFDSPSIVFNSVKRSRTAMPIQSLTLLNSEFVRSRARAFANRLESLETDEPGRLRRAFELAYSRQPANDEIQAAIAFLNEQSKIYGSGAEAKRKAWVDLCQTILISNEFLYLD